MREEGGLGGFNVGWVGLGVELLHCRLPLVIGQPPLLTGLHCMGPQAEATQRPPPPPALMPCAETFLAHNLVSRRPLCSLYTFP